MWTKSTGWKLLREFLNPVAILVVWFVLQAWVLPRFGVKTWSAVGAAAAEEAMPTLKQKLNELENDPDGI